MSLVKKKTPIISGCIFCISVALLSGGCAPSVRYTRSSKQVRITASQYLVTPDWDYRANYHVPSSRLNTVSSSYIGTRYRMGGMSRKGIDCSGLVCLVFREINRAKLPHSTGKLRKLGRVVHRNDARSGDLVFFRGGVFNAVNHVGIYLGESIFIHASSGKGVIKSGLDEDYYKEHFVEIRRIF
jgi:cell wall-associated NlpC family hydrolase